MIDFYKYSKKNFLFKFIIQNIFGIKLELLKKSFFCIYKVDLKLDDSFFNDYMKKYPITKWGGNENDKEHYQSNHDLNKFKILKNPIKQIEKILNSEVKKNFLGMTCFGKFRIKSLWFTIQKKNEGHNKHNHPKSILSGVYYYRIEENKGGELEIFTQQEIINHNPKKNDLIVFNSDTFHSVKPYYGNNDRIAIAWDAIYTF